MVYMMSQCLGDCDITLMCYIQENVSPISNPDEYSSTKLEVDQCLLFVSGFFIYARSSFTYMKRVYIMFVSDLKGPKGISTVVY